MGRHYSHLSAEERGALMVMCRGGQNIFRVVVRLGAKSCIDGSVIDFFSDLGKTVKSAWSRTCMIVVIDIYDGKRFPQSIFVEIKAAFLVFNERPMMVFCIGRIAEVFNAL